MIQSEVDALSGGKVDTWIRWSQRVNGWMWSVMQGANVLGEGFEPSESIARHQARAFMYQRLVGVAA